MKCCTPAAAAQLMNAVANDSSFAEGTVTRKIPYMSGIWANINLDLARSPWMTVTFWEARRRAEADCKLRVRAKMWNCPG